MVLAKEDVMIGALSIGRAFLSGAVTGGLSIASTPGIRSLGGTPVVAAGAILGGVYAATETVTGFNGSGMPDGKKEDPGVGMWLLVTEEGWDNLVFYQFDDGVDARQALARLTMPRVLYDPTRKEVASGGHPVGCNTIRTRTTRTSGSLVRDHCMVVVENGPGNVEFYPFQDVAQAEEFYDSLFDSKPRVLLDATWRESRCGGWNPFALSTIRHRVALAATEANQNDKAKTCPCYLPNTAFKSPDGNLLLAKNLKQGDTVLAADGTTSSAITVKHHPRQKYKLVELITNQGSFKASADHRIVVAETGVESSSVTRPAATLIKGDKVFVGKYVRSVAQVKASEERTELVEVTFEPDGNIEAFLVPTWGMQTRGEAACLHLMQILPPASEEELLLAMPAHYED